MKIYVCENYHDNDSGIFSTKEAALAYLDSNRATECVQEYELVGDQFKQTDYYVSYWTCRGCKKSFRSDIKPTHDGYPAVCDENCKQVFAKACEVHEAELWKYNFRDGGIAGSLRRHKLNA